MQNSCWEEKDVRAMVWLGTMLAGLMLMVPFLWVFTFCLDALASRGLVSESWIRDLFGTAAAFSAPVLTTAWGRRYLALRYPAAVPARIPEPGEPR